MIKLSTTMPTSNLIVPKLPKTPARGFFKLKNTRNGVRQFFPRYAGSMEYQAVGNQLLSRQYADLSMEAPAKLFTFSSDQNHHFPQLSRSVA
jgi:hypothetical protein